MVRSHPVAGARSVWAIAAIGVLALAPAYAARADDPPPTDKSAYSLLDPTPEDQLRSLCTDRPGKSTAPCTVDVGWWQLESDIYNVTLQRVAGVATTTQLFTNPTLKLGVTSALDLEAAITPFEEVSVDDHGIVTRAEGVGDLYLRAKQALIGDDAGDIGIAISPYIKIPTASRSIGDGAVEEGVVAPIRLSLPHGWQLLFDPELDLLADSVGDGRHLNAIGLANLSHPVSKTITVSAELWVARNLDPEAPTTEVSADVNATWIPPRQPNLQFDAGINFGLDRATPGEQLFVGISRRFR